MYVIPTPHDTVVDLSEQRGFITHKGLKACTKHSRILRHNVVDLFDPHKRC